jgi:N-hydroxyarylamine O-acetyltransferase
LETLRGLVSAHTAAIPFENLDPFLERRVSLDLDDIQDKLVGRRRGGYCYEQNSLFAAVLRTIGFDVRGLGARVLWGQADDAVTGRTHMLLHVKHRDVAYAVDVGFGAFTPTGVLMLEPGTEQPTPHGPFRLVDEGETLRMQVQTESGWRSLYRFDLTPQYGPDYESANYFLSTNPASHFVHSLIAARAPEGRRLTLLNRTMTLRGLDGTVQRHEFGSAAGSLRSAAERVRRRV